MKKTYINPAMQVVMIQGRNVLTTTSSVGFGDAVNTAAGAEGRYDDYDWEEE